MKIFCKLKDSAIVIQSDFTDSASGNKAVFLRTQGLSQILNGWAPPTRIEVFLNFSNSYLSTKKGGAPQNVPLICLPVTG
ncbi:MAG: hypothetical protein BWY12_00272 [candidate division BRC1 bacterium ADurb.Bin183]|nr:MAG: hypothetical protein BWY12_00272 [candidate division BRC1 bacterium ADurb.Bin183]